MLLVSGTALPWQNPLFVAAFLVHIVLIFLLGDRGRDRDGDAGWMSQEVGDRTRSLLISAAVLGPVVGFAWLALFFTKHRLAVTYASQVAAAVLLVTHALLLLVRTSHWFVGTFILVVVLGDMLWTVRARRRLPAIQVLLDVVIHAMQHHKILVRMLVVAAAVQVGFLIGWTFAFVRVLTSNRPAVLTGLDLFLLFFSLRWSTCVIRHVISVTTAGAFASYLIRSSQEKGIVLRLQGEQGIEENPEFDLRPLERADDDEWEAELGWGGNDEATGMLETPETASNGRAEPAAVNGPAQSADAGNAPAEAPRAPVHGGLARKPMQFLVQALTVSFGSICAGSLVGLVSPVLWVALRPLRRMERSGSDRIARMARSLDVLVRRILRVSHKYTFTQVAVHGKGWFAAARDTWYLFEARGVEAVVQDDFTDRLLVFGCYVGGSVMALGTGLAIPFSMEDSSNMWLVAALTAFWFGFVGVSLPLTVIDASISALITCFAEIPESLSQCHPVIYHRFVRIAEVRHFQRAAAIASRAAHGSAARAGMVARDRFMDASVEIAGDEDDEPL